MRSADHSRNPKQLKTRRAISHFVAYLPTRKALLHSFAAALGQLFSLFHYLRCTFTDFLRPGKF